MRELAAVAMILSAGCAGPWSVLLRSGPPPALRGARQVTVFIDTSELEVDGVPLAELEARISAAERSELESAMRAATMAFTSELSSEMPVPISLAHSPPSEGELRMSARFLRISRGARGTIGPATEIAMRLDWYDGTEVVDAIEMARTSSASVARPSISRRMRLCAVGLAGLAVSFFESEQDR